MSFYCDASAYPEPIVSWSKVNADDFMVIGSNWLNFTNIGRDEAGDYICIANNTCGETKSSRRSIDVQCKLYSVHKLFRSIAKKLCLIKMQGYCPKYRMEVQQLADSWSLAPFW